jgi:hypothetical protein
MIVWTWTVYALKRKGDTEARYVGMTKKPPAVRMGQHLTLSQYAGYPVHRWMASVDLDVEMVALSQHDSERAARDAERAAIITLANLGHRLLNTRHNPAVVERRDGQFNHRPESECAETRAFMQHTTTTQAAAA